MLEQSITWISILKAFGVIVTIFGSLYMINFSLKKAQKEFATKESLDREISRVEKETDLKIDVMKQSNEEIYALLEYIKQSVDEINSTRKNR